MKTAKYEKWDNWTKAKKYGETRGHTGMLGGWIYDNRGYPICHGWLKYYALYNTAINAWIRRKIMERDNE